MPSRRGNNKYKSFKNKLLRDGDTFLGYAHRSHRKRGKRKKMSEIYLKKQEQRVRENLEEIKNL